jgi:hypothetical protein
MTAMQEFVVPKSMPNTFAIINWLVEIFDCTTATTYAIRMPRSANPERPHKAIENKGEIALEVVGSCSRELCHQWHNGAVFEPLTRIHWHSSPPPEMRLYQAEASLGRRKILRSFP